MATAKAKVSYTFPPKGGTKKKGKKGGMNTAGAKKVPPFMSRKSTD